MLRTDASFPHRRIQSKSSRKVARKLSGLDVHDRQIVGHPLSAVEIFRSDLCNRRIFLQSEPLRAIQSDNRSLFVSHLFESECGRGLEQGRIPPKMPHVNEHIPPTPEGRMPVRHEFPVA